MIARFVALDLQGYLARPSRLGLGAAFLLLFAMTLTPAFVVPLAAAFSVAMTAYTFLGDERGRLDTLYATLPISRTTVVLGRYATGLITYLAFVVAGNIVAVIVAAVRGQRLAPEMLLPANAAAFAIVALGIGIQLPIYFAVGYNRARAVALVPALIVLIGLQVAMKAGFDSIPAAGIMRRAASAPVDAAVVAAGLVALVASAWISHRVYHSRQL